MIDLKKRQFLDFEKPIKELYDQIEQLKVTSEKSKTNMSQAIAMLAAHRAVIVQHQVGGSAADLAHLLDIFGRVLHVEVPCFAFAQSVLSGNGAAQRYGVAVAISVRSL